MTATTIADQPNKLSKTVDIAIKLAGDFGVIPGASQILQGKLGSGIAHAAVGVVGAAYLGPIAWAAVAANSFTTSLSDESIWTHVSGATKSLTKKREANKSKEMAETIRAIKAKDPEDLTDSDKEILEAAKS